MKLTLKESAGGYEPLKYDGEYSVHLSTRNRIDFDNFREKAEELRQLLLKNLHIFTYTNAKLPDAYQIAPDPETFDDWCYGSWEVFEDYLAARDLKTQHLRSTSRFVIRADEDNSFMDVITDLLHTHNARTPDAITLENVLEALYRECYPYSYVGGAWNCLASDDALNNFLAQQYIEEYEFGSDDIDTDVNEIVADSELAYVDSKDVYKAIKEVENIVDAYEYLQDFKDNQETYFQDYLNDLQ